MKDQKTTLKEGMGSKPVTARPSFPAEKLSIDLGPAEGASLGIKPATPRPSFPNPQQQQQPQQPAQPAAPAQDSAPQDKGK